MQPAVDKSVERVQTKLASMLNRLELEISEVEKRIGDKMVRTGRLHADSPTPQRLGLVQVGVNREGLSRGMCIWVGLMLALCFGRQVGARKSVWQLKRTISRAIGWIKPNRAPISLYLLSKFPPRKALMQYPLAPVSVSVFQHVLDRDSDGMVSAEEIAHVVQHVLATKSTALEARAIAEDVRTSICRARRFNMSVIFDTFICCTACMSSFDHFA